MKKWYAVQTKPNQEHFAEQNLKEQGIEAFLPQYQQTKRVKDKDVKQAKAFYPSYLFVSFDTTQHGWRGINDTKGVQRLVSSSEYSATPVPDKCIDMLKADVDANGFLKPHRASFSFKQLKKGDEVVITHGHFMGNKGIVEQHKKNKIVLFLSLLQKKVLVELPYRMVELSNPSAVVR